MEQWQYPEERKEFDNEERLRKMGYYENRIDYYRCDCMGFGSVLEVCAESEDRIQEMG